MKLYFYSGLALFFGSIYTITRKMQSIQQIEYKAQGVQQFNKPIFQAFFIFLGMALIIVLKPFIKDKQEINQNEDSKKVENIYIYIIPSFLDVVGTIFDTAGIFYTNVSISQMLKGFIVIFTYLISILLFKRKMKGEHHLGVLLIFVGQLIIGYSNIDLIVQKYATFPLLGNSLIVLSQFIFSLMFIYEELIFKYYKLKVINVVGWQGIWGVLISGLFIILFSYVNYVPTNCNFFQTCLLVVQKRQLLIAMILTALCIGPFNYFGMSITKQSSALHRCTICSLRMVVVWVISIAIGWEKLNYTQLFGYVVLTIGTFIFNEVLFTRNKIFKEIQEEEVAKLVK